MDKEQAETLATKVRSEAKHLTARVVPSREVFSYSEDDGTYCVRIANPKMPEPQTVTEKMAGILEDEEDWQHTKNTWRFVEEFF